MLDEFMILIRWINEADDQMFIKRNYTVQKSKIYFQYFV